MYFALPLSLCILSLSLALPLSVCMYLSLSVSLYLCLCISISPLLYLSSPLSIALEKTKQETKEVHIPYGQHPTERKLKSRNCFQLNYLLRSYGVMNGLGDYKQHLHKVSANLSKSLARRYDSPWTTWRCLNRLRT